MSYFGISSKSHYHHGFGMELRSRKITNRTPNARSIMSNVVPDVNTKGTDPELFHQQSWGQSKCCLPGSTNPLKECSPQGKDVDQKISQCRVIVEL